MNMTTRTANQTIVYLRQYVLHELFAVIQSLVDRDGAGSGLGGSLRRYAHTVSGYMYAYVLIYLYVLMYAYMYIVNAFIYICVYIYFWGNMDVYVYVNVL
jgi:hypothetical protein